MKPVYLALIVIAGCSSSSPDGRQAALPAASEPILDISEYTSLNLNAVQSAALEAGIRAMMKDPESARFGARWAAQHKSGEIAVCGLVNGKNSYGGYTGEQPFLASMTAAGQFTNATIGSDERSAMRIGQICDHTVPGYASRR